MENEFTEYATHQAAAWLENVEEDYTYFRTLATEILEHQDGDKEAAAEILAGHIEDYIKEHNPLINDNSLYSDILAEALHEMDYIEIASAILDEQKGARENEPEQHKGPAIIKPGPHICDIMYYVLIIR